MKDEHSNISRDISCPCRMLQLDKDVVRACLPVTRGSPETISFAFLNQVRKARFKIIRAQITNYKSIKLRSDILFNGSLAPELLAKEYFCSS